MTFATARADALGPALMPTLKPTHLSSIGNAAVGIDTPALAPGNAGGVIPGRFIQRGEDQMPLDRGRGSRPQTTGSSCPADGTRKRHEVHPTVAGTRFVVRDEYGTPGWTAQALSGRHDRTDRQAR